MSATLETRLTSAAEAEGIGPYTHVHGPVGEKSYCYKHGELVVFAQVAPGTKLGAWHTKDPAKLPSIAEDSVVAWGAATITASMRGSHKAKYG